MRATSSFVTRSGVMARVFHDVVGVVLDSASRRAAGRLASSTGDPVHAGELTQAFHKCGPERRLRRAPVRNGVPYVLAAIIASCGGRTWDQGPPPPGGPGVDTGTGSSAAVPSGLGPDCPQGIPRPTSQCGRDGLECEYGDDREVLCNTVAACSSESLDAPRAADVVVPQSPIGPRAVMPCDVCVRSDRCHLPLVRCPLRLPRGVLRMLLHRQSHARCPPTSADVELRAFGSELSAAASEGRLVVQPRRSGLRVRRSGFSLL
jgi:hypothetical protein